MTPFKWHFHPTLTSGQCLKCVVAKIYKSRDSDAAFKKDSSNRTQQPKPFFYLSAPMKFKFGIFKGHNRNNGFRYGVFNLDYCSVLKLINSSIKSFINMRCFHYIRAGKTMYLQLQKRI